MSRLSAVHRACQRGSFWLSSCMRTSTAPARLLPAAQRASRPTANISTAPRCSAPARKCRVQPSSPTLSDRLELEGADAHMYPQGTCKASKAGCKARRAQLRPRKKLIVSFGAWRKKFVKRRRAAGATSTWAPSRRRRRRRSPSRASTPLRSSRGPTARGRRSTPRATPRASGPRRPPSRTPRRH